MEHAVATGLQPWHFGAVANGIIAVAYFGICAVIIVPLARTGQLRSNKLGVATAAIFFSCAVHHGAHTVMLMLPSAGLHSGMGISMRQSFGWYAAVWDILSVIVAVYYWTLRRTYGSLMRGAKLFEDLEQRARRADAHADRQTDLLSTVLDSIGEGVVVVDDSGRILVCNPAAERLLGRSCAGIADGPLPLARAAAGEVIRGEELLIGNRALAVNAGPLTGTQAGGVILVHDVTARRAAEQAVLRLNDLLEERVRDRTAELERQTVELRTSNAELEAFSYSVSHDLRAPLRSMNGFAAIIAEEYGDLLPEPGRRQLAKVQAAAHQMGQLIDALLAFSRLQRQALQRTEVPVDRLVAQVWDELSAERADRTVELVVGDLPTCHGDGRLIKQVLGNLVGNALKYSRNEAVAHIEITGETTDDEVVYHVRDNGAGFDPRYGDKLFKVFQRLHRVDDFEGTGIGLALVARIVTRHGGRVWADGTPGEGAAFHVALPAGPSRAATPPRVRETADARA